MVEDHKLKVDLITRNANGFLALIKFVNGCCLQGLDGQRILKEAEASFFMDFGSLIALDCLLNNYDRVPAIWDNEGNLSNVMMSITNQVVGIDQQINPIIDPNGKETYFTTLRQFCDDVKHHRVEAKSAQKIRTSLHLNCGVELTDDNLIHIFEGCHRVFCKVAVQEAALRAALPQIDEKMVVTFGHACFEVGLSRIEAMTEFICDSVKVVASTFSA